MSRWRLANLGVGAAIVLAMGGGAFAEVDTGTPGDRAFALIERSRATLPADAAVTIEGHAYDEASRTLTLTGFALRSPKREITVAEIEMIIVFSIQVPNRVSLSRSLMWTKVGCAVQNGA